MSLSLSLRAALDRELMAANTAGFSKHSSHRPRDIKKPTLPSGRSMGRNLWLSLDTFCWHWGACSSTRYNVGVPTPWDGPLQMETTPPCLHSPHQSYIWVTYKLILLQFCIATLPNVPGNVRRASLEMGTNLILHGLTVLLTLNNKYHCTPRNILHPQFWMFQRARWVSLLMEEQLWWSIRNFSH